MSALIKPSNLLGSRAIIDPWFAFCSLVCLANLMPVVVEIHLQLTLNTATRLRGHFRQISAATVNIRQEMIKCRRRIKTMIWKDKTDDMLK